MSLFVRVFNNFYTHRKTARLRVLLGNDALWIPPRLWSYASENQPDGDFSEYEAEEIAMFIGYAGDAKAMLQALLKAGFLDADLKIHDWADHNGYHSAYKARAKKAARARWRGNGQDKKGEDRTGAKHPPSIASSIEEKSNGELCSTDKILRQTELKRVESELKRIRDFYGSSGGWSDKDKATVGKLKVRREELKAVLGLCV